MQPRKSDLEQKVLRLSVAERARLACELLASLDDDAESDVEAAWVAEANRRYEELRSGRVKGRTPAQVLTRARSALEAMK